MRIKSTKTETRFTLEDLTHNELKRIHYGLTLIDAPEVDRADFLAFSRRLKKALNWEPAPPYRLNSRTGDGCRRKAHNPNPPHFRRTGYSDRRQR